MLSFSYIFSLSESLLLSKPLSLTSSTGIGGSSSSVFAELVLDNVSPRVTVIAVSSSEVVELVDDADDVGFVEKVSVGVVLFVVAVDVLFVVAVVLFAFAVVVFALIGMVVVDVVVIMRVVVIPNIFRFVLFLIIPLSSSLVEVGCDARLPEMFQVVKGCHQSLFDLPWAKRLLLSNI